MFDMMRIGKKIASLRKEKNMTQQELADRLGISYQAVSNWERGDSMPDISKLEDLSEIFDVSIDELLGNKRVAELAKEISDKKDITDSNVSEDDLVDAISLQKPKTVEEFVDNFEKNTKSGENETHKKRNFSFLISIAPFISEEKLSKQLEGVEISTNEIIALAPFLSESHLSRIVNDKDISLALLSGIAPFVSEEVLGKKAIEAVKEDPSTYLVAGIAPFLSEQSLEEIVDELLDKGQFSGLSSIAPFLNADTLSKIAKKSENLDELISIVPFLSSDGVREVAKKAAASKNIDLLKRLVPFIDEDDLFDILKEV